MTHHRSCLMCNHTTSVLTIRKHPNVQVQPSPHLRGGVLQPLMVGLDPQINTNKSSICKEPMSWIFYATLDVPKSCTMQKIQSRVLTRCNA